MERKQSCRAQCFLLAGQCPKQEATASLVAGPMLVVAGTVRGTWLFATSTKMGPQNLALALRVCPSCEEVFWQLQKLHKPFGLLHFYPDAGGSMTAISPLELTLSARSTPSRLSANISHSALASNGSHAKQSGSPSRCSGMTP